MTVVFGTVGAGATTENLATSNVGWVLSDATYGEAAESLLVADVDTDGNADLLVGMPGAGGGATGEVWIFLGPLDETSPGTNRLRADADHVIVGESGDRIGSAMAFNDYLDVPSSAMVPFLVVGGSVAGAGANGRVYLFNTDDFATEGPTLDPSDDAEVTWEGVDDERLGTSVAAGKFGVAIGAPFQQNGGATQVGRVYWMDWDDVAASWPVSGDADAVASAQVTGDGAIRRVGLQVVDLGKASSMSDSQALIGIVAQEGDSGIGDVFFWQTSDTAPSAPDLARDLATLGSGDSPTPHTENKRLVPVGDYDGDDMDEFFFGDAGANGSATKQGALYLVAGGGTKFNLGSRLVASGSRLLIPNPGGVNDRVGAVLAAGDYNGDGVIDLAAAAPGDIALGAGSYMTFYGPFRPPGGTAAGDVAMPQELDALLEGPSSWAQAGEWVAGIGDVNCDGVADVAISGDFAVTSSSPSLRAGEAYLHFGRSRTVGELDWLGTSQDLGDASVVVQGVSDGDGVGLTFGLGDLDGDGCDDFAIGGTHVQSGPGTEAGAVYLFYGRSTFSPVVSASTADAVFLHDIDLGLFGYRAARIEDLDGDGHAELALAAIGDLTSGALDFEGSVYLYDAGMSRFSGTYTPGTDADCVVDGTATWGFFGTSLLGVDLSGDGQQDLVVGAPGDGDGKVYAWTDWPCAFGASTTTASADITVLPRYAGAFFGASLAALGPFDAGTVEVGGLAIGAPNAADGGRIRVAVVPASLSTGSHTSPAGGFEICGWPTDDEFGRALGSGNMSWDVDDGDDEVYDQDGALELFVGAPAHAPSVDAPVGRAYGFEGHALRGLLGVQGCALDVYDWDAWWVVEGEYPDGRLGEAVGSGGDLNRDGFDDVIIGQPEFDATNGGEGRAMIGLSTRDIPE